MSPLYIIKDFFGINILFIFFCYLIFAVPNALGHPDNYILANPLSTPPHIVPEWYFLPFYAILRSIPNKVAGVIAMFFSILTLYFISFFTAPQVTSSSFKLFYKVAFWFFFIDCLILGWIGGNPVEYPYYVIGQLSTIFYFFYFYCLVPAFSILENKFIHVTQTN